VSDARPQVALVVSTRDRAPRLEALLRSLREQTLEADRFEVVVVDDGSRDGTAALLQRTAGKGELRLRAITHRTSLGQAAGRNEGVRTTSAPTVAFIDDDCEAADDWLEQGLGACGAHPGTIVQGRTVPHPAERHRHGPFTRTMSIDSLGPFYQTCNIFYPRSLFERLGGFDERLREGEDADLAWRAFESGGGAVFASDAIVFHAVENLGVLGHLRVARRWTDAMAMFRYRGLRDRVLFKRLFWKRSHELLVEALIGTLLARRLPPALLLTLPYARHLRHRCLDTGAPLALMPYFVLHDLLETYTAVRGAIRHRVLVI
jgi:GT2 family glycosyltransferase